MNPYLPMEEYIPDSEPRIFNGRLYLYGSHDEHTGALGYCPLDYVFYSTSLDNIEFSKKCVSFEKKNAIDITRDDDILQAPDCIRGADGRYYLYYNSRFNFECGVAVSESPDGPFEFLSVVKLDGVPYTKIKMFDPGVFVDDDGKVYLYVGFTPAHFSIPGVVLPSTSFVGELESDMFTLKGDMKPLIPGPLVSKGTGFEGHAFYEASSLRKINGKYYFIYSSENSHDLCYAVSNYPDRDFKYQGVLISNANLGYECNNVPELQYGNTHGSVACVNGRWFVFYHRHTHGTGCSRQGCVDAIKFENGKFHQAEMTSLGFDKALPFNQEINSCYACYMVNNDFPNVMQREKDIFTGPIMTDKDDVMYIDNVYNQTMVGFKYFDFNGKYELLIHVNQDYCGTVEISFGANKNEFETIVAPVVKGLARISFNANERLPLFINFVTTEKAVFYKIAVNELK